jgi:hypothetical protein
MLPQPHAVNLGGVNESHVSPEALPAADTEQLEGAPRGEAHSSRWSGGRIAALVIGVLLGLVALTLLGSGGVGLWADRTQREGGYATTDVHEFSTAGAALATERTHLGSAGIGWLYAPGLLGKVRVRVTPVNESAPLFVGIGPSADVDRYLTGVNHTVISDFFKNKVETAAGGREPAVPGAQKFWVASSSGPGERTVVWDPAKGSWTVVVMNADGRPGIDVRADLGARFPALLWIAIGLLVGGAVLLAGGTLLILGAIRRSRGTDVRAEGRSHADR